MIARVATGLHSRITKIWVAGILALAFAAACGAPTPSAPKTQSVFDRVVTSGVIRASYAVNPPYSIKDPNSGKMSGLYVDALEEAAHRLNLKVQWTEEVGWGVIFEGLNSDRYDIFGAGVWRSSARGRVGDFTTPLIYNTIKVWGRPNAAPITDLSKLNTPSMRIATLDGSAEDQMAKLDFPNAKRVSLPQLSAFTDVLLNISTGKADVTFADPALVSPFLEKNPGALKELMPQRPLRVFGNAYAIKLGEDKFKAMLNAALDEMASDGSLERIITKYERHPGDLLRRAAPYALAGH